MPRIPVTSGLFTLGDDSSGHLIGGRCGRCDRWHFPAAADCPYCSAEGCQPGPLGARGTLWLFTTVTNRPPGYVGEVPFGFGVVELPEGLRVIARLTAANGDRLRCGMPMRLCFVPLHIDDEGREVVTYAFTPDLT